MSISTALRWTALSLVACLSGILATRPILGFTMERLAVHAGPWRTSAATGSADANPYERAAVAVAGLYALASNEALYYTAFTDSDARPLDGRCAYRLSGPALPARWWSLTVYGADHYLVANAAKIHSRHAGNLEPEADGSYIVPVSAQRQAHNWLPAPASGAFSITARLYNPDPAIAGKLDAVALPAITRGDCR